MDNRRPYINFLVIFLIWLCALQLVKSSCKNRGDCKKSYSEKELRRRLSAEAYRVTQEKGTEQPYSDSLRYNTKNGKYNCGVCKSDLFSSKDKVAGNTPYPTFTRTISPDAVELTREMLGGKSVEEAACKDCGAHLGQFKNGKYEMNFVALGFKEEKKAAKKTAKKRTPG